MVETSPKSRRRQQQRQQKAETRERILREAAAAIRSEGAAGPSVASIMSRAGLTVGGFYAHFSSKDDLLAAAVRFMFEERHAAFLQPVEDTEAADVLKHFVEAYLSMRHRDVVEQGCPIAALAGEIGRLADPVRAEFTCGMESVEAAVRQLLGRMGHADAGILAGSLIAEMSGAVSLARTQPDRDKAQALLSASRTQIFGRAGIPA